MNKPVKQTVKLILKIAISVICICLVFRNVDINLVLNTIGSVKYFYLLIAALFFILSKFISAIRLNIFFTDSGIFITQKDNLKLYILGMYYNLFLPGGIGGDGYKIYYLNKEKKHAKKDLITAVLADRISGIIALGVLLVAIGIIILPVFWMKIALPLLAFIGVLGYYLFIQYKFNRFKKSFLITNFQGLLVQLAQVICVCFLLLSLSIGDNYLAYLFIFLISSVVAIFPFTIGGLGARELTFLYGSQFFMLDIASAISISLLFYLITATVSFFGIYYSFKGVKLSE